MLGLSNTALTLTKSVVNAVIAVVTIAFLTLFMLIEGPGWVERCYNLLPEPSQPRWRKVGGDIYRTVGGYVTGNLAISLIAGVTSTAVLLVLGVPYAVALGLVVALLDLIPLAGATIAAIIVSTVGFLHSTSAGIVLVIFFVLYQQLENHVLQPLVYGRTVQLSPLIVLVAVLMGAELAGVIGALGAIPVAGPSRSSSSIGSRIAVSEFSIRPGRLRRRSTYRPDRVGVSGARGVARYRGLFRNDHAAAILVWSIIARAARGDDGPRARPACQWLGRRATGRPGLWPRPTRSRSPSGRPTVAGRSTVAAPGAFSSAPVLFPALFGLVALLGSTGAPTPASPSPPRPPG